MIDYNMVGQFEYDCMLRLGWDMSNIRVVTNVGDTPHWCRLDVPEDRKEINMGDIPSSKEY